MRSTSSRVKCRLARELQVFGPALVVRGPIAAADAADSDLPVGRVEVNGCSRARRPLAPEDGCSWSLAPGGVSHMEIIDVTVDPGQRAHGLALATREQPDHSFSSSCRPTVCSASLACRRDVTAAVRRRSPPVES